MLLHTPFLAAIALSIQSAPEMVEPVEQSEPAAEESAGEGAPVAETAPAADEAPDSVAAETPEAETALTEEEQAKIDDENKIVCRREAVIGSKFKKKICATKKEWQRLAERGRDTTWELQARGTGFEPSGP